MPIFFTENSFRTIIFTILLLLVGIAHAQVPYLTKHEKGRDQAEEILTAIYNWNFEEAEGRLVDFKQHYQGHPALPLLEALNIYWQEFPFQAQDAPFRKHQKKLKNAIEAAEGVLEEQGDHLEASFILMMARSIMMRNYANFDKTMKAVGEARKVYNLMIDGFEWKEQYQEFYFSTGLYNYYREYYPEEHPVYKPFAIFFKSGDKQSGIEQLAYAAENTIFSQSESKAYLAFIYFRCEDKPSAALEYYRQLQEAFPQNQYYLKNYIEALLLTQHFKKAEQLNQHFGKKVNSPFFEAAHLAFEAMLSEWKGAEHNQTARLYFQAKDIIEQNSMNIYAESIKTYTYTGLAKYYNSIGDTEAARAYKKLAKKYDEYGYAKKLDIK